MRLKRYIRIRFGVMIVVMLLILGFIAINAAYRSALANVNDSLLTSANLASSQISSQLNIYKSIAETTGRDEVFTKKSSDAAKTARVDEIAEAYALTSGNVLNKSGVSLKDGTDFSDREYVVRALAGESNISDITLSKYTNTYGFSVASPIGADGAVDGVVYFRMDIDFMKNILQQIKISRNSYAYIVDGDGNVIVHNDESMINNANISDFPTLYSGVMEKQSGSAEYRYGGKNILSCFAAIPGTNGWRIIIAAPKSDFTSNMMISSIMLVVIIIIFIVVAVLLSGLIAGRIAGAVTPVDETLSRIARGDFSGRVEISDRDDEIGDLQNSARSLQETLSGIIGEANNILGAMAKYDLTQENMKAYPGEFNSLSESINSINGIMNRLIARIQESARGVDDGAKQLSGAAEELSNGTAVQAESIKQVVSSIDTMSQGITRSSENENRVSKKLKTLDRQIQTGNEYMTQLLNTVEEIEKMSVDIQNIVATIDSIAFQTNILALNASVEAARAGSNGKGFAVVADEVGSLAAKSGESSKQTSVLINTCIAKINEAKKNADSTFGCLSDIVANSAEISAAFDDITADTQKQAEKSVDIKNEISNISAVVQTNMGAATNTASATQALNNQAVVLNELTDRFIV